MNTADDIHLPCKASDSSRRNSLKPLLAVSGLWRYQAWGGFAQAADLPCRNRRSAASPPDGSRFRSGPSQLVVGGPAPASDRHRRPPSTGLIGAPVPRTPPQPPRDGRDRYGLTDQGVRQPAAGAAGKRWRPRPLRRDTAGCITSSRWLEAAKRGWSNAPRASDSGVRICPAGARAPGL